MEVQKNCILPAILGGGQTPLPRQLIYVRYQFQKNWKTLKVGVERIFEEIAILSTKT